MKKGFYILCLFLISFAYSFGQTNGYMRNDSIILTNKTKTAVLVIQNATKDTTGGFLKNIGKGVTKFDKVKISDVKGLADSLNKRIFFSQNFKYADSVLDLADSIRIAKAILIGLGNHFKIKDTLTFTKFSGSNNILITNPSTYINVTQTMPAPGGKMYTLGDSYGTSFGATDTLHGYANLVAKHFGYINQNISVSGSVLENQSPTNPSGRTSMFNLLHSVPIYNSSTDKLYILQMGINDWQIGFTNYTPTHYGSDYKKIMDTLTLARHIPASKIIIIAPSYVNPAMYGVAGEGGNIRVQDTLLSFVAKAKYIAGLYGTKYFDAYHWQLQNGELAIMYDQLHPNNSGYSIFANGVERSVDSTTTIYQKNQNLAVNHISEFAHIRFPNNQIIPNDLGLPLGIDTNHNVHILNNLPSGFQIHYPTIVGGFVQGGAALPASYTGDDIILHQGTKIISAVDFQDGVYYNTLNMNNGNVVDFTNNSPFGLYRWYNGNGSAFVIMRDGSIGTKLTSDEPDHLGHRAGNVVVPFGAGLSSNDVGVYASIIPYDSIHYTKIVNTLKDGGIAIYTSRGTDGSAYNTVKIYQNGEMSLQTKGDTVYNPAAILSLNSTTKGFLPPRMTQAQRDSLGFVQSVVPANLGTGYTSTPTVSISGGGGTGATATANVNLTLHQVTSYTITNHGTGYTSGVTVTVTGGGGTGATATGTITFQNNPGLIIYNTTSNKINYWNTTQWVAIDSTGTGGSSVASVSGTTDRVVVTGTTNPVIDISSTFEALLEKVANKSTTTTLGTSNMLYPTQNAVKTYVDNAISGLTVPSLQSVATVGNSYTAHIQMQALEVTGTAGAGYADMISQSASPSSTSGHIKLYSDSLNRLSWKNSTYRRTIQVPYPSDYTIRMPYRVTGTTLEDSTHAVTTYQAIGTYLTPSSTNVVTNKDLSSLTNTFPTFTAAAGTLTGTTLNSTVVSSSLTSANLSALTATDATLTFSGSYNGNTARTVGINLNNANTWTALPTINIANLLTGNGDGLFVNNSTLATVTNTIQDSPNITLGAGGYNSTTTVDNRAAMRIWLQPTTGSGAATTLFNLRIDEAFNNGTFANVLNLNSFSSLTVANYLANTSNESTSTTTAGLTFANSTAATVSVQTQNSSNLIGTFGEWNTTSGAANFSAFKLGGQGVPGTTPSSKFVISLSQTTTSTPSYVDKFTLDNSGNLTITGGMNASSYTGNSLQTTSNGQTLSLQNSRTYSSAMNAITLLGAAVTNSTGTFIGVNIAPTYNQTSTAAATDLLINRTNTAIGSGNQYFIDGQVGNSSKFHVDYKGSIVSNGTLSFANPTAGTLGTDSILVHNSGGQVKVISANSYSLVVASNDITAQTAAGNITTVTSAASNSTYDVGGYINVTAIATDVIQAQVTFTDENNTSQTISLASISAIGFNSIGVQTIRVKASTTITLKTNLTTGVGTITYDAGGYIKKDY